MSAAVYYEMMPNKSGAWKSVRTGSCSGKDHSVTGIDNYICLKYDTVGHRVYFLSAGNSV